MHTRSIEFELAVQTIIAQEYDRLTALLIMYPNLYFQTDSYGDTLLHYAAARNDAMVIDSLCVGRSTSDNRRAILRPDMDGRTVLHLASTSRRQLLMELDLNDLRWDQYISDENKVVVSFEMLFEAMVSRYPRAVERLLKEAPWLLDHIDAEGNNILHVAAKQSDASVLAVVIYALGRVKSAAMAEQINLLGRTPLHYTACYNSQASTELIVHTLGHRAALVAKRANYDGNLPLKLLRNNPHSTSTYVALLEGLTLPTAVSDLTAKIDFRTIAARYASSPMSDVLAYNFRLACYGVNKTREFIKQSSTHPSINAWDNKSKNTLVTHISNMRKAIDNQTTRDYALSDSKAVRTTKRLNAVLTHVRQNEIGNCGECADVAAALIRKAAPTVSVEVFRFKNGDHCFAVIGRDPMATDDIRTWGPNAVICDPWSGKVYKASEAELYLNNYWHYTRADGSFYNVLMAFDPRYHVLECVHKLPNGPVMQLRPQLRPSQENKATTAVLRTVAQPLSYATIAQKSSVPSRKRVYAVIATRHAESSNQDDVMVGLQSTRSIGVLLSRRPSAAPTKKAAPTVSLGAASKTGHKTEQKIGYAELARGGRTARTARLFATKRSAPPAPRGVVAAHAKSRPVASRIY